MLTQLGILYGGRSAEHEVSLVSATNIHAALDKSRFNPILIFIDHDGSWYLEQQISSPTKARPLAVIPGSSGAQIYDIKTAAALPRLDVVFPMLHGPYGEDGTVQGLLEMLDLPYVGPRVCGSAVGMDKDVMKRLLRDAGVPVGRWICLEAGGEPIDAAAVGKQLGYPCFVKPANMGSSVGISKVDGPAALPAAVEVAFKFDQKVLIEEFIAGREIECAVLGNEAPKASLPGEIAMDKGFYSYEAKYVDAAAASLHVPADLPVDTVKRVQALAERVFKALCCEGLGRVDFFLKASGELLVNEINTIPGFTNISMYPKLWEVSGLPQQALISQLIDLALTRHAARARLLTKAN
jgi:D-alanine-D-alanine ligase